MGDHRAQRGLRRVRRDGVTARRDGDEYVLNGSKTFITNGPYADTIVFICKLDDGNEPADRKVVQFVLDSGMPGLEQSKPLRKMGLHSSPTGELFLDDVRAGATACSARARRRSAAGGPGGVEGHVRDRAHRRGGDGARHHRALPRAPSKYAKTRVQFGKPIGEFQLIQLKLAKMEVARLNVENLVFRRAESSQAWQADEPGGGLRDEALRGGRRDRGRDRRPCSCSAATATWPSTRSSSSRRREGAPDLRRHRRDPGRSDRGGPCSPDRGHRSDRPPRSPARARPRSPRSTLAACT